MATSPDPAPKVRRHSDPCEKAKNPDSCVCPCRGAAHQSNVLRVAISRENTAGAKVGSKDFQRLLSDVLGARFTSLSENPSPNRKVRSARDKWIDRSKITQAVANRKKKTLLNQREQRIVDVTLRDVLALVYRLPAQAKTSWQDVADLLTLRKGVEGFAKKMNAVVVDPETNKKLEKNPRSAYFWSAILAALSESANRAPLKPFSNNNDAVAVDEAIKAAIEAAVLAQDDDGEAQDEDGEPFGRRCHPRQEFSEITEISVGEAVGIAADLINTAAEKAHELGMRQEDFILLVQIVGATVSADLWHQPAAVRHLLIPAVQTLRQRVKTHPPQNWVTLEEPGEGEYVGYEPDANISFTLDGQEPEEEGVGPQLVEELTYFELGKKWETNKNWGKSTGRIQPVEINTPNHSHK